MRQNGGRIALASVGPLEQQENCRELNLGGGAGGETRFSAPSVGRVGSGPLFSLGLSSAKARIGMARKQTARSVKKNSHKNTSAPAVMFNECY